MKADAFAGYTLKGNLVITVGEGTFPVENVPYTGYSTASSVGKLINSSINGDCSLFAVGAYIIFASGNNLGKNSVKVFCKNTQHAADLQWGSNNYLGENSTLADDLWNNVGKQLSFDVYIK